MTEDATGTRILDSAICEHAQVPTVPARIRADLFVVVREQRGLALLVLVHMAFAVAVAAAYDLPYDLPVNGGIWVLLTLLPFILIAFVIYRVGVMVIRYRPKRPMVWLFEDLRRFLLGPAYILNGGIGTAMIVLFICNFTFLKSRIPSIAPFSWDAKLAAWDRWLHFNQAPWEWLYSIDWPPQIVTAVNFCYHLWFFLVLAALLCVVLSRSNRRLRLTFLYAVILAWGIGGNLLAALLSSAGPAFTARLGLGLSFQPLMDRLADAADASPVWALAVQDMLWQFYLEQNGQLGGISAMPSMHVAMAVILALLGFRISRILGCILALFAGSILLGSVALGWHYAVDGYVGVLVAVGAWWIAVRMTRPGSWFGAVNDAEHNISSGAPTGLGT